MSKEQDVKTQNISINGVSLAAYLDNLKDKETRRDVLQRQDKVIIYRKPRVFPDGSRERNSTTKIYRRAELNSTFYERITMSLIEQNAGKLELVLALLLSGKFHTSLEILKELQDKGVDIKRFDVTSCLTRLSKSEFGRLLHCDISKKPYIYRLKPGADSLSVEKAYRIYSSRHPYTVRDAMREYPELEPDAVPLPPAEEKIEVGTRGEGVESELVAPIQQAGEQIIRVKIEIPPIRFIFSIE